MSPTAILYAHSFKHYSTQLAMAPILLLAAVHCNRRPGPRNFALLLAAILVTTLFSYPTVLLLPAVVILVVQPQSGESIDYSRVRQGMLASLWGLGVFGFLYVAVIRHNINHALRVFFANPAVGVVNHLSRAVIYLLRALQDTTPNSGAASYFYRPPCGIRGRPWARRRSRAFLSERTAFAAVAGPGCRITANRRHPSGPDGPLPRKPADDAVLASWRCNPCDLPS